MAFRENSAIPLDILVSMYCKVLTLFCIELTIILHTDLAQCTVTVVTEEGIILHCVLIWMSHCCFICRLHSSMRQLWPVDCWVLFGVCNSWLMCQIWYLKCNNWTLWNHYSSQYSHFPSLCPSVVNTVGQCLSETTVHRSAWFHL